MSSGLISMLQYKVNQTPDNNEVDLIIARYLLKNLYKIDLTINRIAKDCHVSKASVTRFSKTLGFDGFNELKKTFHSSEIKQNEMKYDLNATGKSDKSILQEFDFVVAELNKFKRNLDTLPFEDLCDLIYDSSEIHLFATEIPGSMSFILQNMLLTAGKYVEFYPLTTHQIQDAKILEANDLAVFISLEGSYVMQKDLTLAISESEATSVLITQNPEMKLSTTFDHVFKLGEHDSERVGKYKLLMFIEYLSHTYFSQYV